jgi:predicted nucleotidyltransferase
MDAAQLQVIVERLKSYPVIFAYLFGSHASGNAGPLSDIDVALFVDERLSEEARFDLRLRLSNELSSILEKTVDVIVLNDSPLSLHYEVIKQAKLLLCKDRERRINNEIHITSRYLDRRFYDKRRARTILKRLDRELQNA